MNVKSYSKGFEFTVPGLPPVQVHYSLPLVAILLTSLLSWNRPHLNGIVLATIFALGIFLSMFAHELGHAFAAYRVGATPVRIRMHGLGGNVALQDVTTRSQERRIIIAGPVVNLLLGFVFLALYFAFVPDKFVLGARWREPSLAYDLIALRGLKWLGWFNVAVALINLLPAYPLDGGSLLHGFIADRWGASRARFWVGLSGFALGLVAVFAFIGGLLSGMLLWSPPDPIRNWKAMRSGKAFGQRQRVEM